MGGCIATPREEAGTVIEFKLPDSLRDDIPANEVKTRDQLYDVMKHPQLTFLFKEFLKNMFCAENFMFYLDIEEYKTLPKEKLAEKSKEIMDKYFDPEGDNEIAIEDTIKDSLRVAIQTPNHQTFDFIQQLVLLTLEGDCLPNFLNSEIYQDFVTNSTTRRIFIQGLRRTNSFLQLQRYVEQSAPSAPGTGTPTLKADVSKANLK